MSRSVSALFLCLCCIVCSTQATSFVVRRAANSTSNNGIDMIGETLYAKPSSPNAKVQDGLKQGLAGYLEIDDSSYTASKGNKLYATPADRNDLLVFLEAASQYGEQQLDAATASAQNQTYYNYTSGTLSMVLAFDDLTLFNAILGAGWSFFGRAAELMRLQTLKTPQQNTTWVGTVMKDANSPPQAALIITEAFIEAKLPAGMAFPTATTNNTNENNNDGEPKVVPGDMGIGNGTISVPANETESNGNNSPPANNESSSGPYRRRDLTKRRDFNLGTTGYQTTYFEASRSVRAILSVSLATLTQLVWDMFIAESFRIASIASMDIPLDYAPNSPAGWRFQFQVYGSNVVDVDIVEELLKILISRTVQSVIVATGARRPLHGQIIDTHGIPVAVWSLGALLSDVTSTLHAQPIEDCISSYGCISHFLDEL